MTKLLPAPDRLAPVVVAPHEPIPAPGAELQDHAQPVRSRASAVQYVDFRTTERGREYTLRASGAADPRLFVLLIPGEAFASRAVRFQDGPDLCFRRLQRELTADPDLLPNGDMALTAEEISEYRAGREQPANERRRRQPNV